MSSPEHLVHIIKSIPENPGVYQYYDIEEKLIYVGKAKFKKESRLILQKKIMTSRKQQFLSGKLLI